MNPSKHALKKSERGGGWGRSRTPPNIQILVSHVLNRRKKKKKKKKKVCTPILRSSDERFLVNQRHCIDGRSVSFEYHLRFFYNLRFKKSPRDRRLTFHSWKHDNLVRTLLWRKEISGDNDKIYRSRKLSEQTFHSRTD